MVVVNRLTDGSLHFFVGGAPWTHRFWSWMFNVFALGCALALLTVGRRCTRRREAFNHRTGSRRRAGSDPGIRVNTNIFARRCLNCGLRLDGANTE